MTKFHFDGAGKTMAPPKGPRPELIERDTKIVSRVLAGETLSQVGNDYGLLNSRVSDILKTRLGRGWRAKWRPPHGPQVISDKTEIIRLKDQGLSAKEISARLNISHPVIYRALRGFQA